MRYLLILLILFCSGVSHLKAQDGKLLSKTPVQFTDSVIALVKADTAVSRRFGNLKFSRITYLSDGLKVNGYLIEPTAKGKYPCIIANRGGNRELGKWEPASVATYLGAIAGWGYVVIASQYRGCDGSEGRDEFGGSDLNDVFNLIPLLAQLPSADTSRIGLEGGSRGGMMTYMAMRRSCRFKAATVRSGMADLDETAASRKEMDAMFKEIIDGYTTRREEAVRQRSAVQWANEMCKTTPLLIMHGTADWRVSPVQPLALAGELHKAKVPFRLIMFEGTDHFLSEVRNERLAQMRRHYGHYLRDGKPWPSLEPHGR